MANKNTQSVCIGINEGDRVKISHAEHVGASDYVGEKGTVSKLLKLGGFEVTFNDGEKWYYTRPQLIKLDHVRGYRAA